MRSRDELSPDDQRRVEEVTSTGIHSVERKPFRPVYLLVMLLTVTTLLSLLAIALERMALP